MLRDCHIPTFPFTGIDLPRLLKLISTKFSFAGTLRVTVKTIKQNDYS